MHEVLRDRIWRHLEALPDERVYQVLDYIEFLSSKYARDDVSPPASSLRAFGERLEDKLRVKRVGMSAIRGTLGLVGTADRMVSGVAQMGRSVLREVGGSQPADGATRKPAPPPAAPPEDIPVDG
jgi:hypothetical protein